MSGVIHTPVDSYGEKPSTKPSGNVVTDGKVGPDLPSRSTGANSIPEITYDQNASLPKGQD